MRCDDRVPVTVIAGFLGAGKTSYLNRRLASGDIEDALILVNDVGEVNVDVAAIDYRDDRVLSLSNGCVCCTLGGTLAEQLSQALRLKARPTEILIEASGVANPQRIADIARLAPGLELADIVVLVDASQAGRLALDAQVGELWRAQVHAAHRLLVNRLPQEDSARDQLLGWLGQLAPGAAVATEPVQVAPASSRTTSSGPAFWQGNGAKASAEPFAVRARHSGLTDATLHLRHSLVAEELQVLLERYRDCLFRAKGFVRCRLADGEEWRSLQLSGQRLAWQSHGPPATGAVLVCIGRRGERFTRLMEELAQLDSETDTAPMAPIGR
ncbi:MULTISPECIES: GTP-binding protein [unclassified Halomonas]|uniref:GTP-binding protein n=1 Tax=Halomonas sp. RT37 TaxID=2950872 RepID=A0AAU7KKR6_9GAMM|nr:MULTISPECIES: GTP-binding protein [unclassified Halomonas]MBY6108940.1 GTP-binding protein [Halomonas sp. DP1Y21-3]MCO7217970.1 GTP-binding protein [Halomonas sp. OfavH-34-E]RQW72585.1 GTP-binding protein [Halomonas sp. YLB-10]